MVASTRFATPRLALAKRCNERTVCKSCARRRIRLRKRAMATRSIRLRALGEENCRLVRRCNGEIRCRGLVQMQELWRDDHGAAARAGGKMRHQPRENRSTTTLKRW